MFSGGTFGHHSYRRMSSIFTASLVMSVPISLIPRPVPFSVTRTVANEDTFQSHAWHTHHMLMLFCCSDNIIHSSVVALTITDIVIKGLD